MSASWKQELIGTALPPGYRREAALLGRVRFLDNADRRLWSHSDFVARTKTPRTTSSVEAVLRRRHLERMIVAHGLDKGAPVLDLGCADGTLAHDLLELAFEKLVSTDILPNQVAHLAESISEENRDRVLLLVDDMLELPFSAGSFGTVIAWGVLSVSGDFERALELAWTWLAPGGHLLVAEPVLEQALVYPLVRGDLAEFRRVVEERTRAAMWDRREDRYPVNPAQSYPKALERLPGASIADSGGVNMLASLVLGGLAQDSPVPDGERDELVELLSDPSLDELSLWRQGFWLTRKA